MATAKCYLYDIVNPDPSIISYEKWQSVKNSMNETSWLGENGSRMGFVGVEQHKNLIAGFFANEGLKRGFQYDENKKPIQNPVFMFEHLFFILLMDTSQLVLQHRNIYGYENLGLGEMRDNLLQALTVLLRLNKVYVANDSVKISPSGEMYSQEELYEFFRNNRTIKLVVNNLDRSRIPDKSSSYYPLYNPKAEWTEITWGAIDETVKVGVRNIVIEGMQDDPSTKLNKGPLPKAFAAIGNIEEITAEHEGKIIVRRKSNESELTFEIPSQSPISLSALEVIADRFSDDERKEKWERRMAKRKREQIRGTLYDDGN